ncbi:MAG: phenylalanine--tRNA ligase subunit beta [Propionibacteriaceae bacterium]|jgi:phenylalanyl-tRNA synthetase beta chain|nr:phenylalanine--tRNA ligase subunit beta [Propionibacteriaceae bacterium]
MRASYEWINAHAVLFADVVPLAEAFTQAGLLVEQIDDPSQAITGKVVVGRVVECVEEPQKNGKTIRWCQVDCGDYNPEGQPTRGVICGAPNVCVDAYVPVVLPGSVLPGGFEIVSRKTYGHISDGMICAEDELGIGDDHSGIIIFDPCLNPQVGSDALELLGAKDPVYEIDVTPDTGYCLSIRGLAREAAQVTGGVFNDPYDTPVPDTVSDGYPVVLDSEDCVLFVAISVGGVDPDAPTPEWMVRRLKAVGVRSISLAVDITNYVMMESGQPLHAYDQTTLQGPIRVRKATEGEKITTLDHVDRVLSKDDLLITDDSGPIGLAGVMGGLTTELTQTSTEILIEAAWFNPASVGRTYRRHYLPSEASRRFERGVDAGVAYAAAMKAAELLRDLGGGTISSKITVAGSPRTMPTISFPDWTLPGRILGIDLTKEKVIEILEASGVSVVPDKDGWILTPPTWRPDLVDPYDYIEEVGRKIGFGVIEPRIPSAPLGRGYTRAQKARRAVLEAVAAAGFAETIPLPFISGSDLDRMDITADDERRALVRIANPLSEEQPYLRSTLLPGLFTAVNRNTSRSLSDLALFDCGLIFRDTNTGPALMPDVSTRPSQEEVEQLFARLPHQPRHLGGVLTGEWLPANDRHPGEPATWVHAIYLAEIASLALGTTMVRRKALKAPWHPGRCAELGVMKDGEFVTIGWAGEIHPKIVQEWNLPARACAVEIDLDALIELAPSTGQITPLSKHPATKQDLALVVDEGVPSATVLEALREGAGELLESIALFDVFMGTQVGVGKKSLAFNLIFRAQDRTLTEAEASAARDAAVAEAGRQVGAVIRS